MTDLWLWPNTGICKNITATSGLFVGMYASSVNVFKSEGGVGVAISDVCGAHSVSIFCTIFQSDSSTSFYEPSFSPLSSLRSDSLAEDKICSLEKLLQAVCWAEQWTHYAYLPLLALLVVDSWIAKAHILWSLWRAFPPVLCKNAFMLPTSATVSLWSMVAFLLCSLQPCDLARWIFCNICVVVECFYS